MKRRLLICLLLPLLLMGSAAQAQDFSFYRPPVFEWELFRRGPDTPGDTYAARARYVAERRNSTMLT